MLRKFSFAAVLLLLAAPLSARNAYEQAHGALDHNDPQSAANILEAAIAQSPNDAEAHYLLGVAYGQLAQHASVFHRMGYARKTRDEFEKAVAIDPDHLMARFSLVQYYTLAPGFLGGSIERAQQQATQITKRDPAAGHRALAFIDGHLKHYREAAVELRRAAALDPGNRATWYEIGHLAAVSGANLEEGEQALMRYVSRRPAHGDPSIDDALAWLKQIYQREGKTFNRAQLLARASQVATSEHAR